MENMDKELFLKMYADIQENSKVMARVEEKVNNIVVVTEQQQKQINKLIEDNIKPFRWVSFHVQSTRRRWKMLAMPAPAST